MRVCIFYQRRQEERERKKRVIEGRERDGSARLREGVTIHVLFAETVRFAQN